MANNYLHSEIPSDFAEELLGRTGFALSPVTRDRLIRVIERHLRATDEQAMPVRNFPPDTPAWAIRARDGGATLLHCLPTPKLHKQVQRVAKVIHLAERVASGEGVCVAPPSIRESLEKLVDGIGHWEWEALYARCQELGSQCNRWNVAQQQFASRQIFRLPRGRQWRRLCSIQEIWDASEGTIWCVKKGGIREMSYHKDLALGHMEFWVLESKTTSFVLVSIGFDDNENIDFNGEFLELKDRTNEPPVKYRPSVRRLALKLGISIDESRCSDIKALALDNDLGRANQPHWEGDVTEKRAMIPLSFRLWADGRRKKYFAQVAEIGNPGSIQYLRLCRNSTGKPMLDGNPPDAWQGSAATLMRAILRRVQDERQHWIDAESDLRRVSGASSW